MKKVSIIFFIIIVLFGVNFNIEIGNARIPNSKQLNSNIYLTYEVSLGYNDYASVHGDLPLSNFFIDNFIEWEFSGNNPYVGITVMAMTESNFEKFENSEAYESELLSEGGLIQSSGEYRPETEGVWYIVFINLDSSLLLTDLTYNANFTGNGSIPGALTILVIIACVLIPIVIIAKKRKK